MILLPNPTATDRYLANGITPILAPVRPAVVIQSNFNLPMRSIVNEGTNVNGYILHDCEISPLGFSVQNTRCGGNMCDRQQESVSKCACY